MKLSSLFNSLSSDIYIDLGTANTIVMDKKRGMIANEPSVIAYRESSSGRREIVAVGKEAKMKTGRTPGNMVTTYPLKDGVIAELDATQAMLRHFLGASKNTTKWIRPNLVISLPYGVSDVEKRAVRDCGFAAGAREVILIEEPMAAAIGADLPVHSSQGSMIIDIGGGTTESAVIALYGVVHCEAVRVGGHAFDDAIMRFIRRKYDLIVGSHSAEKLKMNIGSALPGDTDTKATIRGVDFATGLPREVKISSHEVCEAITPLLNEIVAAGKRTLERTPPELFADIIEHGAIVAGGGALIQGIATRLQNELGIPVRIAEDPLLAIARGGQKSLGDSHLLSRIELV
jgi:rod shape-determining protein MreB and related proteins